MIELADDVSADELSFCKSKINQAKSFKGERHDETLNRFKSKKDIDKPPNQAMKASGVTIMPLLCGKYSLVNSPRNKSTSSLKKHSNAKE